MAKKRTINIKGMDDSAIKASTPDSEDKIESFEGMQVVYRDARKLKPHPLQKEYFGMIEDDYADILPSITASGVRQPLRIWKLKNGEEQISAGHRRQGASLIAGTINPDRYMIPCIIDENINADQAEEDFISTNFFRNIPKVIQAKMLQRQRELISKKIKSGELKGKTADYLANSLGVGASTIKRLNRLTKLIPELQDLSARNIITQDQALKLYNKSEEEQRDFFEIFNEGVKNMTTEEVKKAVDELSNEKSHLKEELQKAQKRNRQERETLTEQIVNLRGEVLGLKTELKESDSEDLKSQLKKIQRLLQEKENALVESKKNGSEKQIQAVRDQLEKEKQTEIDAIQKQAQKAREDAEKFEKLYQDAKDFDVTTLPEYQQLKEQAEESKELKDKQDKIEIIKDADSMLSTVSDLFNMSLPKIELILNTTTAMKLNGEIDESLQHFIEIVGKYQEVIDKVTAPETTKLA